MIDRAANNLHQELSAGQEAGADRDLNSAEGFLTYYESLLNESSQTWRIVASTLDVCASDELKGDIADHIRSHVHVATDNEHQKEQLRQQTARAGQRLAAELAPYFLSVASHIAVLGEQNHGRSIDVKKAYTFPGDRAVNDIVSFILKSTHQTLPLTDLPKHMYAGNRQRRELVSSLVSSLAQNPNLLVEIEELAVASDSAPIAELKKVAAIDWYQRNPGDSLLKSFINEISASQLFAERFVNYVAAYENGDEVINRVREMARFALVASGVDPRHNPAVEGVLQASQRHWMEFDDIAKAFDKFRDEQTRQLVSQITKFVGSEADAKRSVRFPREGEDIDLIVKSLSGYFDYKYLQRKEKEAILGKLKGRQIPDIAAIEKESKRAEKEPLQLAIIKQISSGSYIFEAVEDAEALLKPFEKSPDLANDLRRMIELIRIEPFGQGTKQLNLPPLKVDGRQIHLRRMSPQERMNFSVKRTARKHRVVYAVLDGQLGLHSIVPRNKLGREY